MVAACGKDRSKSRNIKTLLSAFVTHARISWWHRRNVTGKMRWSIFSIASLAAFSSTRLGSQKCKSHRGIKVFSNARCTFD